MTNIWSLTKRLSNKKPRQTLHPLHGQQGLIYSDEGKTETFADAMELQFSPNDHLSDSDTEELVINSSINTAPDEPIHFISPKELAVLISHLKTKSAPGPDSIPYKALKLLPRKGVALLTSTTPAYA